MFASLPLLRANKSWYEHNYTRGHFVKEWVELYLHPNTPSWRGAQLKKKGTGTTLPLEATSPFTLISYRHWQQLVDRANFWGWSYASFNVFLYGSTSSKKM
jgi:hypothetical protein